MTELFFRSLKEECVWQHQFASFAEAEQAVAEWVAVVQRAAPTFLPGLPVAKAAKPSSPVPSP